MVATLRTTDRSSSTPDTVSTGEMATNILHSHLQQRRLGQTCTRAPHSHGVVWCDPQDVAQAAARLPSVNVDDIRVGNIQWLPSKLTIGTMSSAAASQLAIFTQPQTTIHGGASDPLTSWVVIPSGPFIAAYPAARLAQRDIHVIELSHHLLATFRAIALAPQELAFYHGGSWGHLAVFGEVMDRVGGQVRCLSLYWRNVDGIGWHDMPAACALLKLSRCTALRSLAIWISLRQTGREGLHWRMATETLAAARHTSVDHIQLVIDVAETDSMPTIFEEFKQARWAEMKHSLSRLPSLKTISIANTATGEAFREELFGIAMKCLKELRRAGVRIVESKGPVFTVS